MTVSNSFKYKNESERQMYGFKSNSLNDAEMNLSRFFRDEGFDKHK